MPPGRLGSITRKVWFHNVARLVHTMLYATRVRHRSGGLGCWAMQVLFLIAVFTTLASAILHDQPSHLLCLCLTPTLVLLCLSIFLVTIYSGGLRSREAHAYLASPDEHTTMRRAPESVLSHAISFEEVLASLRGNSVQRHVIETDEPQRTYIIETCNSGELAESVGATASLPLLQPSMHPLLCFCRPRRHDLALQQVVQEPCAESMPQYGFSMVDMALATGASGAWSEGSVMSAASELYHEQPAGDLPPSQMMRTAEFHLLVFVCFVTMGAALSLLNNLNQMLVALEPINWDRSSLHHHEMATSSPPQAHHHELATALVVCFSVANTLGRIAAGYLSELALHHRVRAAAPATLCRLQTIAAYSGTMQCKYMPFLCLCIWLQH
jgi:hypothetical protein